MTGDLPSVISYGTQLIEYGDAVSTTIAWSNSQHNPFQRIRNSIQRLQQ